MVQKIVVWLLLYEGINPVRIIESKSSLTRVSFCYFTHSWLANEAEHQMIAPSTIGFWKDG